MYKKEEIILSDFAKQTLIRINEILTEPHLLIGGLAVQQYYKSRDSADIDLVCTHKTKNYLIESLFPSKEYNYKDENDDEYRPSWVITHKLNNAQIVLFGPKILERAPYQYLNWDTLLKESNEFVFQDKILKNIKVPKAEELAYSKLISFLSRFERNPTKGKNDLIDFINISNSDQFQINKLINIIKINKSEVFINESLRKFGKEISILWDKSLFIDLVRILSPSIISIDKEVSIDFGDNFSKIYGSDETEAFYDKIASYYHKRNTSNLKATHKAIAKIVMDDIKHSNNQKTLRILDIGGGTGSIADLFFNYSNIEWHNVDISGEMLEVFSSNLKAESISVFSHNMKISEFENSSFDYIISSFFLSSFNLEFNYELISRFCNEETKIIIADFHPDQTESNPFFDFEVNNERIAFVTKKIYPMDLINELLKNQFKSKNIEIIRNEVGKRYSFIIEFDKLKNFKTNNEYFIKVNNNFLESHTSDEQKGSKEYVEKKARINNLSSTPNWVSINAKDLIGTFQILGINQNQDRTEYNGTLTLILNDNNKIDAIWLIDNGSQEMKGSGFYKNNILVINFTYEGKNEVNYKGIAVYKIINKDLLNGFWSEKFGDQRFLGEEQCVRL